MTESDSAAAPLAGVRVLDLSRVLAGPWATQTLADLGADVVKIERPDGGDDTRSWGPPFLPEEAGGDAAYFLCANRGKRSVRIDIAAPEGAALVRRMAAASDVVVENFRVGGLVKYGLDYASMAALHPRLVYCSITGFGQTGPLAERAGYDFVIQAMSGLMSVTGAPDGPPTKVGVAVSDLFAGLYASTAILAALHRARRDGKGAHVDVSLLDCQIAALANQCANALVAGAAPGRLGNAHPNIVPYQDFEASDARFALACGADRQFARLCDVVGRPDWARDARYATNAGRVENRDALTSALQEVFRTRCVSDWMSALSDAGVPAGPIRSVTEALYSPEIRARELVTDAGPAGAVVGAPIRFAGEPVRRASAPPRLGEHERRVIVEDFGVPQDEYDRLAGRGVVGGGPERG